MRCRFVTVDVFTSRPLEGNALAVFPDARGLSDKTMQRIAREFNLSETTFVFPPEDPAHARRLRIFTPTMELPFAGHPTVGTAYALAALGEVPLSGDESRVVLEENLGPVPVLVRSQGGRPVFTQLTVPQLPKPEPEPPGVEELAEMLALQPADIVWEKGEGEDFPEAFFCGASFVFVPLRNRDALSRARLNTSLWDRLLAKKEHNLYLFCREPELRGSHFRARMFGPAVGVTEDPATGAGVSAFGGYVGKRAPDQEGTLSYVIEQGFEMGRPSLLYLEVDKQDGEITAVRVGGPSVMVAEGTMEIPEG